jgi:hypothetical protein
VFPFTIKKDNFGIAHQKNEDNLEQLKVDPVVKKLAQYRQK